ncbi:MAG TPA: DegT/DnrJ/EryC1/StrS family aminotransferase [Opitutales bacterium]|nr:DegT/DnrJ/EryC1/StrS family aminotransferase [Opitutales bacterium]
MKIPLLDVNAQNLPLETELKAAFEKVLRSGRFILGPEVSELEGKIAEMAGARHAIGVSSGTDALLLALMTLGIGPGDEVLCPAFTFFATAGSISRIGARPVFVDSLEETFNIDLQDAAGKVTKRTKAIVPVHLFGLSADMRALTAFAEEHKLAVIEDDAQALGAECHGRPVGGIGDFGTFSFFPSKNLGGFGDGGMVVCNDDQLAEKARSLRSHGSKPKYFHHSVGGNFRLDELQAALLLVKLPYLKTYTDRRRENAMVYRERLAEIASSGSLILPIEPEGFGHVWNQYTIRIPGAGERDRVRKILEQEGVATEIYYPLPLDAQECFRELGQKGSCPVAERLSTEVLSIPIGPELTKSDQERVLQALSSAIGADQPLSSAESPRL